MTGSRTGNDRQPCNAAKAPHECQRCGSNEWEYVDYGGCSMCRPYEDRDEDDAVARWVAWARTTSLRYGLTTFGGNRGS